MQRAQKVLWRVAAVGALLTVGSFGSCVGLARRDAGQMPDSPVVGVLFWVTLVGVGIVLLAGATSGVLLLVDFFRRRRQ